MKKERKELYGYGRILQKHRRARLRAEKGAERDRGQVEAADPVHDRCPGPHAVQRTAAAGEGHHQYHAGPVIKGNGTVRPGAADPVPGDSRAGGIFPDPEDRETDSHPAGAKRMGGKELIRYDKNVNVCYNYKLKLRTRKTSRMP